MNFPDFMMSLPALDLPFDTETVEARVIRSDHGLAAFFIFYKDMDLPPHSHKGQWGTVLEGQIELTIGDATKTFRPGDSYNIPSGVVHSGRVPAGTKVIDVFEEPDRYPIKA
ncbi:cupin domain-containing protein [Actibacterium lipolyticum]|uniref:Cupin domain protein n=1 Tax=Actibacterium lipolyticum TaxID=1524263 RepID=A0A238JZB4_9RHOB|nr:cupin domain-containing protein [Actibacterium lipolyticum]SMX35046.1 Cupin domain protein [Actibacterium lipolyticum]